MDESFFVIFSNGWKQAAEKIKYDHLETPKLFEH